MARAIDFAACTAQTRSWYCVAVLNLVNATTLSVRGGWRWNGGEVTETFSRWEAAEHVRTPEDARLYLEACADEDLGDGSLIRASLNDVARAGNACWTRASPTRAAVDGYPLFASLPQCALH